MMIGAKDNETLILLPTLATITSSCGYVYQNFAHIFSFGNSSDFISKREEQKFKKVNNIFGHAEWTIEDFFQN
jgi:hypothetical protein